MYTSTVDYYRPVLINSNQLIQVTPWPTLSEPPLHMRHRHDAHKPAAHGRLHAPSSEASRKIDRAASPWRPLGVPLCFRRISAFDRGKRAAPADSGAARASNWSATSGQQVWGKVCAAHLQSSSQSAIQHLQDEYESKPPPSARGRSAHPEHTRA